ncbi:serine/threonine protein kinase [Sulfolobus acidocaldarius SUSAZ]|nr:serine/threonine protein kinase [Sulfolobus acidocaldarius SUSAZ]
MWVGQEVYGYRVIEVIGLGGNGYVMKVEKNGSLYAMKVLSVNKFTNSLEYLDNLLKESENLEKLSKDPRFVSIYGSFIDKNNIQSALAGDYTSYYKYPPAIVMEFMDGGTLLDLISRVDIVQSKYWQYIVKLIIKEIGTALMFLHKRGYVHLDVKPQNIFLKQKINGEPEVVYKILFSSSGMIKLGDLGSSVRVGEKISQATPAYSPPEQIEAVITGKGAQPSMDNYALGATLYRLLTMKNLDYVSYLDKAFDEYIDGDPKIAMKYVNMAKMSMVNFRPKLPPNTLPELANILQGTLVVDPRRRLTSYDIVNILER